MISIIIPAHNEAKYISQTLNIIKRIIYPENSFEVIIVENGSDDETYKIASKFSGNNIKVFHLESKGVSKAKNFGLNNISKKSEWTIFLDADTVVGPNFLTELDLFLSKNKDKNFAIGTTEIMPLENKSWYAMMWMKFYNIGHKYTKTSFAIQIMKSSLRDKVKFDEKLSLAEDLQFIKDCLKFGNFFFLNTKNVFTSTRRFEKIGWINLFIKWNYDALMWRLRKISSDYLVIR